MATKSGKVENCDDNISNFPFRVCGTGCLMIYCLIYGSREIDWWMEFLLIWLVVKPETDYHAKHDGKMYGMVQTERGISGNGSWQF